MHTRPFWSGCRMFTCWNLSTLPFFSWYKVTKNKFFKITILTGRLLVNIWTKYRYEAWLGTRNMIYKLIMGKLWRLKETKHFYVVFLEGISFLSRTGEGVIKGGFKWRRYYASKGPNISLMPIFTTNHRQMTWQLAVASKFPLSQNCHIWPKIYYFISRCWYLQSQSPGKEYFSAFFSKVYLRKYINNTQPPPPLLRADLGYATENDTKWRKIQNISTCQLIEIEIVKSELSLFALPFYITWIKEGCEVSENWCNVL